MNPTSTYSYDQLSVSSGLASADTARNNEEGQPQLHQHHSLNGQKPPVTSSPAGLAPRKTWNPRRNKTRPWPWWAFLGQILTLCCLVANGLVLAISDKKPQSSWSLKPSVILGVLAPVGALCLSYVHKEAATISWWLRFARGGTAEELHREWVVGQSVWHAVAMFSLKFSSSTLAISTISLTFAVAINPLLQRASRVELGTTDRQVLVNTSSPVNIPINWSTTPDQVFANHAGTISSQLLAVVQDYAAKTPIPTNVTGCDGTCLGTLQSWGLNGSCSVVSTSKQDWARDYFIDGVSNSATLFNISFPNINLTSTTGGTSLDPESIPQFQFTTTFWTPDKESLNPPANSSTPQGSYQYCPGTITTKTCTYFVDLVSYPVAMTNTSIQLNSTDAYFGPPQQPATHLEKLPTYPSLFSGFQVAARNLFSSSVQISNPSEVYTGQAQSNPDTLHWVRWDLDTLGILGSQHASFNYSDSGSCFQTYSDPTDDILSGLSDILLRSAIAAAQFSNDTIGFATLYQQEITAREIRTDLVFVSNYIYFAIAAVLMLLEVVLMSMPFWGWWKLNRMVTLSPLETAVALKNQIHIPGGVNADDRELMDLVGLQLVRHPTVLRQPGGGDNSACGADGNHLGDWYG